MKDEINYKASEALIQRRFKTDIIDQIEKITIEMTSKRLSSAKFDELIQNEPAELQIKLAQAEQQYQKFLEKKDKTTKV